MKSNKGMASIIRFIFPIAIILGIGYFCFSILMNYFIKNFTQAVSSTIVTIIFVVIMFILWRLKILKW